MSMDNWRNSRRLIETQKEYEERIRGYDEKTQRKGSFFETCMIFVCLAALVIGCIVAWGNPDATNGLHLSLKAVGLLFQILGR